MNTLKYEHVPVAEDEESEIETVDFGNSAAANTRSPHLVVTVSEEIAAVAAVAISSREISLMAQLKLLLEQALPVISSFFIGILGNFINLAFAGHIGDAHNSSVIFAGISLANMFSNVTLLSLLIGMTSAVETLASQSNGAENYREVGIVYQRSVAILSLIALPLSVVWIFSREIFLYVGIEPDVAAVVHDYLIVRILAIPCDIINISYEKYLIAIGVMNPPMWSNVVQNLSLLVTNLIFLHVFHLSYHCLAWSWVISVYIGGLVQYFTSWKHPSVLRTMQPWDKEALSNWKDFISLGLPGTLMLCSEWWAYEILTFFASQLGTLEVGAQTIILQTAGLAFMVPLGLGIASTSLVGNALGAGKTESAIRFGKLALGTIVVLEIFLGFCIYFGGRYFVDIFTSDPGVRAVAIKIMPFLSLFAMIDGLQGVSSGILRGGGKQSIGAVLNVISFYTIGLPMAWLLCFRTSLEVRGLMIGISCGTGFQVVAVLSLILCFEKYVYRRATPDAKDLTIELDSSEGTQNEMIELR